MSSHAVIQLFGKLPTHGDFVARGLLAAERDMLDAWLSNEMRGARERYGNEFEVRFDSAPPWLFAHDDQGGVLCPSVDSAGRRFPLLVGRKVTENELPAAAASACAETVYEALGRGFTVEEVVSEAAHAELSGEVSAIEGWWPNEASQMADFAGQKTPSGLLSRMLEMAAA